MSQLITVPCFNFEQGDIWGQEEKAERPIQVQFYNGSICLEQGGQEIILNPDYLEKFFREIRKHKKNAEIMLKKK